LKLELIGQQFDRLLVISAAGKDKTGRSFWLCRCNCGAEKIVAGSNLKSGNTKSCGCLRRQLSAERLTTHGGSETPEYTSWRHAKARCTNPNDEAFEDYGGRGIKFLFDDFKEFLSHLGPKPGKKYTLERILNSGNYEHGNVCWATQKEQNRNRRSNHFITYQGETLCLAEWAEKLGFKSHTIDNRLRILGWSVEKSLSTPERPSLRGKSSLGVVGSQS
jgi:hypothetical protein